MKTEFIPNNRMDFITSTLLNKAGISTSWEGFVKKIDIDYLIEFEFELDMIWENINHLSTNGVVLAAIFPEKRTIYLNESQKDLFEKKIGTMNFTKAHELGHWVLHVTKQKDYKQLSFSENDIYFCRGGDMRPPEEIQADKFAASILMPKEIIKGAIFELKEKGEIHFSDLYRIKDAFEVSISALINRVHDLKLLYIIDKKIFSSKEEANGQLLLL